MTPIEQYAPHIHRSSVMWDDEANLYVWVTLVCGRRTMSKRYVEFDQARSLSANDLRIYAALYAQLNPNHAHIIKCLEGMISEKDRLLSEQSDCAHAESQLN